MIWNSTSAHTFNFTFQIQRQAQACVFGLPLYFRHFTLCNRSNDFQVRVLLTSCGNYHQRLRGMPRTSTPATSECEQLCTSGACCSEFNLDPDVTLKCYGRQICVITSSTITRISCFLRTLSSYSTFINIINAYQEAMRCSLSLLPLLSRFSKLCFYSLLGAIHLGLQVERDVLVGVK